MDWDCDGVLEVVLYCEGLAVVLEDKLGVLESEGVPEVVWLIEVD